MTKEELKALLKENLTIDVIDNSRYCDTGFSGEVVLYFDGEPISSFNLYIIQN